MFIVAAHMVLSGVLSAQTIDLQGTVVDESLQPVAGATVTLQVNALETTTNDEGRFHFSGELAAFQKNRIFSPSGFVGLRNNRIELGNHTTARIRVVSIRGAVLSDCIIEKKNGIPIDRILPSTISSQALVIDISTDGATCIVRAIKCGGKWVGNGTQVRESKRIGGTFAAGTAVIDTLKVKKSGYKTHYEPLASLLTSVPDIVLVAKREEGPSLIGDVVFSLPSQTFSEQLEIALSTELGNADIRYTTDGTVPSSTSARYQDTPLQVSSTTQLRAQAFVDGSPLGDMSTAIYIRKTFDASSDIPIVVLEGYGGGKPEDKFNFIDCAIFTFEPVDGVASTSAAPTLATRAGYHLRGQSSIRFEKAPYRVELRDNRDKDADHPFLGMPAESDWALIGPYTDKTLIRNAFVYTLGRDMGLSTMQYRFAEVYINQDDSPLEPDDYQGVYTIVQTIKNQKTRLDLKQLDEDDVDPSKLSGGYIFKFDQMAIDSGELELECIGAEKMGGGWGRGVDSTATCWDDLELVDPSPANEQQIAWITGYIQQFHDALHADPIGNWTEYIDMPSFVDLFLINEITRDVDAYIRSHYMYKERNEPIHAGPLWDYNFALDNYASDLEGWHWEENRRGTNDWHLIIWKQPEFMAAAAARWQELRGSLLTDASIDQYIETVSTPLTNAAERDLEKWPIGEGSIFGGFGNDDEDEPETWPLQLENLKTWTKDRIHWLDSAFTGAE